MADAAVAEAVPHTAPEKGVVSFAQALAASGPAKLDRTGRSYAPNGPAPVCRVTKLMKSMIVDACHVEITTDTIPFLGPKTDYDQAPEILAVRLQEQFLSIECAFALERSYVRRGMLRATKLIMVKSPGVTPLLLLLGVQKSIAEGDLSTRIHYVQVMTPPTGDLTFDLPKPKFNRICVLPGVLLKYSTRNFTT